MKTGKVDVQGQLNAVQPSFHAYASAGLSLPVGYSIVQANTETFDVGGGYDTVNYKFVAPLAGKYMVYAFAYFYAGTDTHFRYVYIAKKSGAAPAAPSVSTFSKCYGQHVTVHASGLLNLAASDEIYFWVLSETSTSTLSSADYCYWGGARVSS